MHYHQQNHQVSAVLLTTLYPEKNAERRLEYERCLTNNLNNNYITQIRILDEGCGWHFDSPKVITRPIQRRPTYNDFFNWINEDRVDNHVYIIANSDICVDSSIRILEYFNWSEQLCLAVSRWDMLENGQSELFERGDSQDAWIFKGKIDRVQGNFPLGVYDCDNKIAWELEQAGYRVINPCYAVRTYHHHQCGYRSYEVTTPPDYGIRPPFRYVEPDNEWGPIKAWQIQRELNLNYLPWMMTRQTFWRYPVPKLACRFWNKLCRSWPLNGSASSKKGSKNA